MDRIQVLHNSALKIILDKHKHSSLNICSHTASLAYCILNNKCCVVLYYVNYFLCGRYSQEENFSICCLAFEFIIPGN